MIISQLSPDLYHEEQDYHILIYIVGYTDTRGYFWNSFASANVFLFRSLCLDNVFQLWSKEEFFLAE